MVSFAPLAPASASEHPSKWSRLRQACICVAWAEAESWGRVRVNQSNWVQLAPISRRDGATWASDIDGKARGSRERAGCKRLNRTDLDHRPCPRRESNPHLRFRKPSFYPLNYGDKMATINVVTSKIEAVKKARVRCFYPP